MRRLRALRASSSVTLAMMTRMAVGTPGARLVDLVGLEHEVLAQHRQLGGVARRGQELRRALEGRRVGQHGEAGRAARLVGAGQRRRVEIRADQALRRARLLDLGDQPEPPFGPLRSSAAESRADGRGVVRPRLHLVRGRSVFAAAISSRL